MLEQMFYFINHHTAFLYTILYKSDSLFIDNWSFIHFTTGLWILLFACYKRYRHPFLFLGWILFSWECLEISFIYVAIHVFKPETIPDQLTDILIGFTGGFIGWFLWQLRGSVGRTSR